VEAGGGVGAEGAGAVAEAEVVAGVVAVVGQAAAGAPVRKVPRLKQRRGCTSCPTA
jgi:hypothetical protein